VHAGERDVVDRRDRNRICDFAGGEPEKFPGACGGGDRELNGVIEALRHHWNARLLGRGENGPEVVTWVTESARRHVAVEQICVAHKTGVEERRLICGCLAATD
jgi:hypothetical protein